MAWTGYSESGQGSQERGPRTFANDVGPVAQAAPVQVGGGGVRGGIRFIGNGTGSVGTPRLGDTRAPAVASVQDKTLSFLMGAIQDKLAPKIKAEMERAQLEGAARHASGVALEEIINEQPWYANVFGTAPAVEGARMYSVQSNVSRFVAEQAAALDDMKAMSPEEVSSQLYSRLQEYKTGDADTDNMIQMELVKQVAPLVKAHTKAHVEYVQSKANEAHYSSLVEGGRKFQRVMENSSDVFTEEDKRLYSEQLAEVFLLPAGRNPETHWRNVQKSLIHHAAEGNTHVLAGAMQTGVLAAMPPDTMAVVTQAFAKAAPGAFMRVAEKDPVMMESILALQLGMVGASPEQTMVYADMINEKMAERTGIPLSIAKFLDGTDMMNSAVRGMNRQEAQQGQLAREQAAAQKEVQKMMNTKTVHSWLDGKLSPEVDAKLTSVNILEQLGMSNSELQSAMESWARGKGPAELGHMANKFHSHKIDHITNLVNSYTAVIDDPKQDIGAKAGAWEQLAATMQGMSSGTAQVTHLGEDLAAKVKLYTSLVTPHSSPAHAATQIDVVFRNAKAANRLIENKELTKATDTAINEASREWWLGSTPNDATRQQVHGLVEPLVRQGMDPKMAVASLSARGALIAGAGTVLIDTTSHLKTGSGTPEILQRWSRIWGTTDQHEILGAMKEAAANHVQGWTDERGSRTGGTGGDIDNAIYMVVNLNGNPVVMAEYTTEDNRRQLLAITDADIHRLVAQRKLTERDATQRLADEMMLNTASGTGINADASAVNPITRGGNANNTGLRNQRAAQPFVP